MKYFKKYLPHILIFSLFFTGLLLWYLNSPNSLNNKYLKVVFLDVGQGDSIYIQAPNGKQVLIDGGPDAGLLSGLSSVMPFADRSLDMIIATHGDMDHIGGFPILIDNYKIGSILSNGISSDSEIYKSLEEKVSKNKINKIISKNGMHIILDEKENIYIDILSPYKDMNTLDSNDASIVGKLVYGETSFMLTGDASLYTENLMEWNEKDETLNSDILKLGHHGAKTASSILWLEKVSPNIAIVSAGKNNKYGHPSTEVIDRLSTLKIPYLNTADIGNIIFESDGVKTILVK
jgi:competence protein ComEC